MPDLYLHTTDPWQIWDKWFWKTSLPTWGHLRCAHSPHSLLRNPREVYGEQGQCLRESCRAEPCPCCWARGTGHRATPPWVSQPSWPAVAQGSASSPLAPCGPGMCASYSRHWSYAESRDSCGDGRGMQKRGKSSKCCKWCVLGKLNWHRGGGLGREKGMCRRISTLIFGV